MRREEKVIQEKRTVEATKKNLMGVGGKLGMIARYLGDPIIQQGTSLFDLLDEQEPKEEIPSFEDGDHTYHLGWIFDGLSRGMQIEIKLLAVVENGEVVDYQGLKVAYKGYDVYQEESGELYGYAPFEDWEDMVDKLYKQARQSQKVQEEKNNIMMEKQNEVAKQSFIQTLRSKWGL